MDKKARLAEHLAHLAAQFFNRESNRTSLITVTRAQFTDRMSRITIFISVFPEKSEQDSLIFAKRYAGEFREYLKSEARMQHIPHIDMELDYGEKNRQRLDELSKALPTNTPTTQTTPVKPKRKAIVKQSTTKKIRK